jgi:predicted oxidoreductase
MNAIGGGGLLAADGLRREIAARDEELANGFSKDAQIQGIHNARRYRGDRMLRVAKPHRILDPAAGPLIGVKLHTLTRKSLGGIQTDLESRVRRADGSVLPGLWAAGEAAGFGGGGVHGYNALEGTFLGGCLFSGRAAGRSIAAG